MIGRFRLRRRHFFDLLVSQNQIDGTSSQHEPAAFVVTVYTFPAVCPQCTAKSGMPYRAETMANGATCVDLRCRDCHHEWQLEMPPPGVTKMPKQSQRKSPRTI